MIWCSSITYIDESIDPEVVSLKEGEIEVLREAIVSYLSPEGFKE